jgi:L-amino acid N-acyltransferase YncA
MIRPFEAQDTAEVLAIWNPIIRHTIITFASDEKTAEGLAAMVAERRAAGREFFVAEEGGVLLGFASYAQFRGGNGYVHAMEHTVILGEGARGRGVGRALMAAVEDHARAAGCHTMVAGVSGENEAGIAFHQAVGYLAVGLLPESGRKFGRWLDLVLLQKVL